MLSFTVRMRFEPKDHDRLVEILRALTTASRQEPGCLSYTPHFVADDPNTVVIYEQYKDEAALEAHRGSPHFKQYASGGLFQLMIDRMLENLNAIA
jgi:quinol monooxygenase YgiN